MEHKRLHKMEWKRAHRESRAKPKITKICIRCQKLFTTSYPNHVRCGCRPVPKLRKPQPEFRGCFVCGKPREHHQKFCGVCGPIIHTYHAKMYPPRSPAAQGRGRDARPSWRPDEFSCDVCGTEIGPGTWNRHHITPRKDGGNNRRVNLALLCIACHEWVHASPLYAGRYTGPADRGEFAALVKLLK